MFVWGIDIFFCFFFGNCCKLIVEDIWNLCFVGDGQTIERFLIVIIDFIPFQVFLLLIVIVWFAFFFLKKNVDNIFLQSLYCLWKVSFVCEPFFIYEPL